MASVLPPIIDRTANVSTIPVTTNGDPSSYRVVFSVPAGTLGPDNVVLVETQVEFDHGTHPFRHVVSVARQIIRAASPTDTTGTPVNERMMADVGPGEWSGVFSMMAVDDNMPAGTYYYNVVMFACSAQASYGETVTIPQGYGECSILIFNKS